MECLLVYSLFKVGKGVLMKILFCLDGGDLERRGLKGYTDMRRTNFYISVSS